MRKICFIQRTCVRSLISMLAGFLLSIQAHAQCAQDGGFNPRNPREVEKITGRDYLLLGTANSLNQFFGVTPKLLIFDDFEAPNAYASPVSTGPQSFGTVYIGETLMTEEMLDLHEVNTIMGIMAHEYGHILQLKKPNTLTGKLKELQADFLAGFYMGRLQYVYSLEIDPFTKSLYLKGDKGFWSRDPHGTPTERVTAMKEGFRLSYNFTLDQAYAQSEKLLKEGLKPPDKSPRRKQPSKESPDDAAEVVQLQAPHFIWEVDQGRLIANYDARYLLFSEYPVQCEIKVTVGSAPRDATPKEQDEQWKLVSSRTHKFRLSPDEGLDVMTISGKLAGISNEKLVSRLRIPDPIMGKYLDQVQCRYIRRQKQ